MIDDTGAMGPMTRPAAGPRPSEPIQRLPIEVKSLRWGLFLLIVASAGVALFAEPWLSALVRQGALSPSWRFLPPALFVGFLGAYAIDRWYLVQRRSYPPGRAFFQVVFGVLFAFLLLPSTLDDLSARAARAEGALQEKLLLDERAEVRAVAVEALGFRGRSRARARALGRMLHDPSSRVRDKAAMVLARWSGRPLDDRDALEAWAQDPEIDR